MKATGEIIIEFDTADGFRSHVDVDMVRKALAVVLEQDAHDEFTLSQALEIIQIRVGAFNITTPDNVRILTNDFKTKIKQAIEGE